MVFAAFVLEGAMRAAELHAAEQASRNLESLGLLVGRVFQHEGEQFVFVEDYLTAENDATAASVHFSERAFVELAAALSRERGGKIFVGWLHSHPGYGCWMSETDLATQRNYFNEQWHVAIVVDPRAVEQGGVAKRAFKMDGGNCREVPFAVVRKK